MVQVKAKTFNLLSFVLAIILLAPHANAASSSNKVLVGFQNYLKNAATTYESASQSTTSTYRSFVARSEGLIISARRDFASANKIKVLKLGDNRNYWGNFNCPPSRTSCLDVDKGPKFEVGEITTIKDVIAENTAYLDEIDLIISLGLIELLNPLEYQRAAKTIRDETRSLSVAKTKYNQDIMAIEDAYSEAVKVEPAILAAKRAGKNLKDFDKAFVTALAFQYNQRGLDELASLPFRYINSLKSLDSAIKVTKLSNNADSVANSYTMQGAININKICGNTFTSDAAYQEMFRKVAQIYKELTGRTLKP